MSTNCVRFNEELFIGFITRIVSPTTFQSPEQRVKHAVLIIVTWTFQSQLQMLCQMMDFIVRLCSIWFVAPWSNGLITNGVQFQD